MALREPEPAEQNDQDQNQNETDPIQSDAMQGLPFLLPHSAQKKCSRQARVSLSSAVRVDQANKHPLGEALVQRVEHDESIACVRPDHEQLSRRDLLADPLERSACHG